MAVIGPEVSKQQLTGVKANVGLRPATTEDIGGNSPSNAQYAIKPEGEKAPLVTAYQVAYDDFIRGWKDPMAIEQASQIGAGSVASMGYTPQWRYVPFQLARPEQMIYDVYALAPVAQDGPGDRPITFLRSVSPPTIQNFAMQQVGMPVTGGNLLMSGLYTPDPITPPGAP